MDFVKTAFHVHHVELWTLKYISNEKHIYPMQIEYKDRYLGLYLHL